MGSVAFVRLAAVGAEVVEAARPCPSVQTAVSFPLLLGVRQAVLALGNLARVLRSHLEHHMQAVGSHLEALGFPLLEQRHMQVVEAYHIVVAALLPVELDSRILHIQPEVPAVLYKGYQLVVLLLVLRSLLRRTHKPDQHIRASSSKDLPAPQAAVHNPRPADTGRRWDWARRRKVVVGSP